MLNPNAPEFTPFQPENIDHRSLYFTFSNGFPLTERQIFEFFNRGFPGLVEWVSVSKPPLHGRVVFKNTYIAVFVMGGCAKACFSVDGRPFYCRRFKPKTAAATATATASTSRGDGGDHPGGDE